MLTHSTLSAILLLPLIYAAPTRRTITPITDGSQVNGRSYDYVIAGGGLAGSVLASRLSEDASRSVLVIEAGYDQEGNTGVTDAGAYQSTFGSAIDWAYKTVPQSTADGRVQTMRSGKALGGSTTINGQAWTKPHTFQIDALETVGNAGLNWASLEPYMLRAENFQPPTSSQLAAGVTYSASCRGTGGPIGTQYDPSGTPSTLEKDYNTTVKALGLPYVTDLTCGDPAGAGPVSDTRSGDTRIDAYRGYLYGKTRPNLTSLSIPICLIVKLTPPVLTGATVGRVLLSNASTPRATGLAFQDSSSNQYTVNANLEVIMATGSIKTPSILQQSGIGPGAVLQSAGVAQRVDLPVGQNLIDQTTVTTSFAQKAKRNGGQVINFPRFQDLVTGSDAANMTNMLQNDLATYAQQAFTAGAASSASSLQTVFEIQRDWILNRGAGISESFDYSGSDSLGYDSWYLLPFSRGFIQIKDNNPYGGSVTINPRYFSTAFDKLAQDATLRFTRTVSSSSPLKNDVTGEDTPGVDVPQGASLDAWGSWAEANYRSNWHPIGTAAMMSQAMGGVVDARHRVYGVTGLRVVDGSNLPFQVSAHLMSVIYGLSERASDLIKADHAAGTGPSSSSSSTSSRSSTSSSSSASPTAPPTSTGVAIHPNGDTSKCLEVRGTIYTNGVPVEIYDCNGASNQKWVIAQGATSVKVAGTNYCLDAGSSPASGVAMKIWQCYSGLAAQSWNYGTDSTISLQGQCLDLTNGDETNSNVVQTWACAAGNTNQKWTT